MDSFDDVLTESLGYLTLTKLSFLTDGTLRLSHVSLLDSYRVVVVVYRYIFFHAAQLSLSTILSPIAVI